MTQHRIVSDNTLYLRATGDKRGTIIAGLAPGTIVHVTGMVNKTGFVPIEYHGWLSTNGATLYPDSLAQNASRTDGTLYMPDEAEHGDPDVYGRTPVTVAGWMAITWLEAIEK